MIHHQWVPNRKIKLHKIIKKNKLMIHHLCKTHDTSDHKMGVADHRKVLELEVRVGGKWYPRQFQMGN